MKLIELQGALTAPCGYKWYSNGKSRFNKNYRHYLIKEDKIMTREEKLWTMTGNTLIGVAEKLGLTVNKNILKQGKGKLIDKILEAEAKTKEPKAEESKPVEKLKTPIKPQNEPVKASEKPKAKETTPKAVKEPKRANLKLSELTYKGETKSIKEWAAQINMPWATLYDRVNRNGWPVDLAIETPLGQRRPKNKEA